MNPLKELHEQLSYNIHAGTDKEATEVAIKIKKNCGVRRTLAQKALCRAKRIR
jgi:uncharacterized OsmC-like protein